MQGQRRRRWVRIGPALGQSLVFAGSVNRTYCVSHIPGVKILKLLILKLIEPKDDLVTVDKKNGLHHIKIFILLLSTGPI